MKKKRKIVSGEYVCQHAVIRNTRYSKKNTMSSKNWRCDAGICNYSSTSKDFNCDDRLNNQAANNEQIIIWCDKFINENEQDDQHTLNQLYEVGGQVIIFTDEQGCLEYIDKIQEKNKLMLIVSGSLGKSFVPKIYNRVQIYLIYIFCGRKMQHKFWAEKYEKIKDVFDNIIELRKDLEGEMEKLKTDEICRKIVDLFSKKSSSSSKFQESFNINNSKHDDDHQSKDDLKIPVISANVPSSKEVSPSTIGEMEINNSMQYSETVAPYVHYKQQTEFADTGKKI